jgi:starch synthase
MKIVFACSEAAPYASTGGLGEVAHALPAALHKAGADVVRVMPLYRQVMEGGHPISDTGLRLKIPVGFRMHTAEIWASDEPGPRTYFVRRDEYFDRRAIYALPERDYTDNFERFSFFQKAVVALIDALKIEPDIVHCHDWTTGLIPMYLKHGIGGAGRPAPAHSVFTIHNLAYQGIFPGSDFPESNLPFSCFSVQTMEFFGQINCLKAGLTASARVTTVSPTYAQEILNEGFGYGLEGVLKQLGPRLTGILNGVDYGVWDPERDADIEFAFSSGNPAGKALCREALIKRSGWSALDPDVPVYGMVVRLVAQKGIQLLDEVMPRLVRQPFRLVLLGSGQEDMERRCVEWMRQWPDRVHVEIGYDRALAHRIQAGSDFFLMPSEAEPGGLSQLYAMRYGTVPVVNAVGGLKDTVRDLDAEPDTGNGIVMAGYTAGGLLDAMDRSVRLWRSSDRILPVRKRIMLEDHSWTKSAKAYLRVYEEAKAQQA